MESYPIDDVRLRGYEVFPDYEAQGRVEVLYMDRWKSVCADRFDDQDATVVCRQTSGVYNM